MPTGISLHIGLNTFDPDHYGYNGQLYGCENDAKAMKAIATSQGFTDTLLLTEEATTRNVVLAIKEGCCQVAKRRHLPHDIFRPRWSALG
ncbi:MAG: hypothetical protein R3E95_17890 [Thiolinea sp.]